MALQDLSGPNRAANLDYGAGSPQTKAMTDIIEKVNPSEYTRGLEFKKEFMNGLVKRSVTDLKDMWTLSPEGDLSMSLDKNGAHKFVPFPNKAMAFSQYQELSKKYNVKTSMPEFMQIYSMSKQVFDQNLKSKLYEPTGYGVPLNDITQAAMGSPLQGYLAASMADQIPGEKGEMKAANPEFAQFLPQYHTPMGAGDWAAKAAKYTIGGGIGLKTSGILGSSDVALQQKAAQKLTEFGVQTGRGTKAGQIAVKKGATGGGVYGRIARAVLKVPGIKKIGGAKIASMIARTAAKGLTGLAGWALLLGEIMYLVKDPDIRSAIKGIFSNETGLTESQQF